MRNTLERANYHTPTPIQEQTLEPLMNGRDLVGVAQTGTGKTAAFVIPIVERIQPENRKVQALILCPTRELALQTTSVIKKLSAHLPIRTVSVYGGQSPNVQLQALRQGAQIVVGTPGRVKDFIGQNALKLANVRFVVLDEADEMLDYGFLPDIKSILSYVTGEHQTMLFSATMSKEISVIAEKYLVNPLRVEIGRRNEPTKTVRQMCVHTAEAGKIVTVGQLMQQNSIMREFRAGKTPVLVATDVAARGIDVDNIDLVINYDVPDKPEYYVHRIGRTGRAGHSGLACTLVSEQDSGRLQTIKRQYNVLMAQ